jgi:hypothetical protein
MKRGFFQNLPKLNPLESILLIVVVFVFCFIGLLASSALFDFELPLDFLLSNKPSLAADPPYPGVFLYEKGIYFDIQQHEGLPKRLEGIPTSSEEKPVIVFWQSPTDLDEARLVYQTGEYIPFSTYQGKSNVKLIQPLSTLNSGLYCLQQPLNDNTSYYWCFNVTDPTSE